MAFYPVSGSPTQYSNENNELASDYWLKFYIANTTTAISMYTDDTGATPLAKCKLNADGFPITNPLDDDTVFIPYVDQNFRYVIFKNETDADNNTTSNAFVNVAEVKTMVAGQVTDSSDLTNTGEILLTDDAAKVAQSGDYFTYGGTADAITLTSANTTPVTSLVDRQRLRVFITVTNTGAATANTDGTGAKAVVTPTGAALPAGFFRTDVITELEYDLGNDRYIAYRKVESGSNANGEFTRWEDGTQICRRQDTYNLSISTAQGSVFVSASVFGSELFAQPFTVMPETTIDVTSTTNIAFWLGYRGTAASTTNFGSHRLFDSSSTAAEDYNVIQTATGKWY